MKIIKEGHNEDKMRVRCPRCEAELEISSEDIEKRETHKSVWGELFYTCPCCTTEVTLKAHKLPFAVETNVSSKPIKKR